MHDEIDTLLRRKREVTVESPKILKEIATIEFIVATIGILGVIYEAVQTDITTVAILLVLISVIYSNASEMWALANGLVDFYERDKIITEEWNRKHGRYLEEDRF